MQSNACPLMCRARPPLPVYGEWLILLENQQFATHRLMRPSCGAVATKKTSEGWLPQAWVESVVIRYWFSARR